MNKTYTNELNISITQELVDEYNKQYLAQNTRRKKIAIDSPLCPTINKFTSMIRMQQNDSKQKYKDFMMWVLAKNEIPKLMLEDCEFIYKVTYNTKTRRDLDNACFNSKFYGDAFVEYGLLQDDSYFQIKWLHFTACYEKGIRKLDINIRY